MGILARYADIRDAVRDTATYSSKVVESKIGNRRPLIPNDFDPPIHRSYRRLLDPMFSPRSVAVIADGLRDYVRSLLAAMPRDGSVLDFHTGFAEPIPPFAFLNFIGVSPSGAAEIARLKDACSSCSFTGSGVLAKLPPRHAGAPTGRSRRAPSAREAPSRFRARGAGSPGRG